MIWYAAGFVWIVQILFWGLGLALLITPPRWRRFWPGFCAPAGLALQSLVVWIGTHLDLRGTDRYALCSQIVPAGLLLVAWWRLRRRGGLVRLLTGARRWGAVAVLMGASLSLQAYPFTKPPALLTSQALGSCDAADYAAGARVFKEFARGDRTGFLGNTDITRALAVDNFFDFWLRLNHFSPSAVIALNASLCERQPYELTSLLGVVLLALTLPSVFWLARSAFRFEPAGALAVTALYGFSPIEFYAVYQTALGQLMATPAVALLTWVGWQAYRGPKTWRRLAAWSGLLLTGDWLVFGSYNFFILFAYIPLLAYVGVRTLHRRDWNGALRWSALVGANLGLCTLLFPGRVISIVERFRLFNQTPFGWSIPGFWPSGWYGAFADARLTASHAPWAMAFGAAGLAVTVIASIRQGSRGRWRGVLLAVCCTLPILLGYWILLREDRLRHDNASYDAFKLFAVFYPGVLLALCLPLRGPLVSWRWWVGAAGWWGVLLVVNLASAWQFNVAVRRSPFVVDPDLAMLSEVERLPQVQAVNITMRPVWEQLWANCFLLHKNQYFEWPTYEGRPVTALRGQWDLSERLVTTRSGGPGDLLEANRTYALLPRSGNRSVEARLDQGWFTVEHAKGETWAWGKELPTIRLNNPHAEARTMVLNFSLRSLHGRHLCLRVGEQVAWEGFVGEAVQSAKSAPMELSPGPTLVRFETPEAPDHSPGDPRNLTFLLNRFEVDLQEHPAPAGEAAAAQQGR